MGSDGMKINFDWKWVALFVLVLQNSGLSLMMRYSRIVAPANESYITSTAVVSAEIIKLIISAILCLQSDCNWNITDFIRLIRKEFGEGWREFLKLFVPSGLYVVQNNLQYIAASKLPADVFQVLYQMKVVTTAIFSVTMLGRKLSVVQWASILALTAGIALVQLSQSNGSGSGGDERREASFVGLVCVVCSSLTSGFAGVYFEKVLKSTTSCSVWLRNIQLAIIGVGISGIGCVAYDLDVIHRDGFFRGYSNVVWIVILLSAAGGLVVAVVVKYADNVLKGFATSSSIVLSCLVSSFVLGDSKLTALFVFGAAVVCASAFAFSLYPPKSPSPSYAPPPSHRREEKAKTDDPDDDDVPEEEVEFLPMSPAGKERLSAARS